MLAVIACRAPHNTAAATGGYTHRRLLLRDEGISQLALVDLQDSSANWYVPVPVGRDVQLVGNNRVLIGTANGYQEHDLTNGKKLVEVTRYPGTVAARRLRNGHTLLTGVNWQGKKGIVLIETGAGGDSLRSYVYPGFDYVRLVRETMNGNFLVTANNYVFEGDRNGAILWKAMIGDAEKMHAWQALRLANGQTVVSTGYAKTLAFFSADGKLVDTVTGPATVHPNFFAGFQRLHNGNYVVANWQGHGTTNGALGRQVLEYDKAGRLVWSWQQDARHFSSLHNAIILDELDLTLLQVEDADGKLAPVAVSAQ
ncbi:MAG TPA: hypothetical protein VL307_09645 [Chitinophagaceae bacterium]|nr:hypothetical protein [Chitinophagaceae bacterium]